MMLLSALSVLLVVFVHVDGQSEGDVRLIGGSSPYYGRLDIFWKGKWGTFCSISAGGAQAACRQLGYLDAVRYLPLNQADSDWNIPKAGNDVPIAIGGTSCNHSFLGGALHVLRCGVITDVPSTCVHDADMVIVCENLPLWQHPYDSQIRLKSTTYPSQGALEIYLNHQWGYICYSNFNQHSADTACRQLGYTNAVAFTIFEGLAANVVWLDGVSCTRSCECLNGCFKSPNSPTSCTRNEYVSL
jgi:hypothetical protein